ncbi:zinc finger Y-chromosomal protein-like [Euwallacea fornicatus]|uniref:zinc finger Y-chromosomal protein-like n=1 Tax=Euwallacea fornicatus TaxID=995702 RepID=UPI0033903952
MKSKPRTKASSNAPAQAKPTGSTSGKVLKAKKPRKKSLQGQPPEKLTKLDNWLCKLYGTQGSGSKDGTKAKPEEPSAINQKKLSNANKKKDLLQSKSTNKKANKSKQSLPYKDRSSEYTKLDSKDYKCAKCDYTHSNLISIRSHFDKEHSSDIYKCKLCPFETKQQYYFNSHVKQHSKPDEECPHCKKVIKWFSFKMHLKTHERNDKTEYKCEICNYRSYNHANVKRHSLTQHKNPHELKSYSCESCNYVTVLEERLKQHKRVVHSKEGNWVTCKHCDYKTRNKSHMTRHVNDLHKEKSVQCSACSQLFSSKEHLKYHMQRKHTDQTTRTFYYCEMCPKEDRYKTTEKGNLARHILAHRTLDEIEVFSCHKCPYLGKSRNALKTHLINAHLPEMHNFKCKICGYSTNTKSRYNTHVRIVHGQPKSNHKSVDKPQNNNNDRATEAAENEMTLNRKLNNSFNGVDVKEEVEEFI